MLIKDTLKSTNDKWYDETRRKCRQCGHTVHFFSRTPYIECNNCGYLIFKDKKSEYNYRIKRRFNK